MQERKSFIISVFFLVSAITGGTRALKAKDTQSLDRNKQHEKISVYKAKTYKFLKKKQIHELKVWLNSALSF